MDSYKLPVLASLVLASFWIDLYALYASGIWRRNDTHRYITLYYILENSHFEPKKMEIWFRWFSLSIE